LQKKRALPESSDEEMQQDSSESDEDLLENEKLSKIMEATNLFQSKPP